MSKPFLLDPHTIPEGIPLQIYLANKFGEKVAKQEMKGQGPTAKAGKSVGIKFEPTRYVVNSTKSHLFLQYVLEKYGPEAQHKLEELMCQQYFEEGANLFSDKVLLSYADQLEINKEEAHDFFTKEQNLKKLLAEVQKTKKKGILGVPYYKIHIVGYNDTKPVTFSGGQSKSGFMDTIHKLMKDYHKANKIKK